MSQIEKIEHEIMLPLVECLEKALVRLRAVTRDEQLEANGWIKHTGNVCPVHEMDEVKYIEDGKESVVSHAAVSLNWLNNTGITHYKVTKKYDIHAENKAQYDEDAKITAKPWELWEVRCSGDPEWGKLFDAPVWSLYCEYRRKPAKKLVDWSCHLLKGCHTNYGELFELYPYGAWLSSQGRCSSLTLLRLLPPATPTSNWQVYHQGETNLQILHDAGFEVQVKHILDGELLTAKWNPRVFYGLRVHYRVIGIRDGFTDVPESAT